MTTITRNTKIYSKKLNGRWYLLKSKARFVYALNKTANRIWDLTISPITLQEIITILSRENKVDPSFMSSDIKKFIQELIKEEYLV